MPLARTLFPARFRAEHLFRPASVAVVGAASVAGAELLGNLRAGGFAGPLMTADTPAEIAAFAQAPELAFLCADEGVLDAIAAVGERGTRAAVVVANGEVGAVAAAARAARVRVYGPNSAGIAVPSAGLQAIRSHAVPRPGRAALVFQSGALCRAVLDWAEPNGVGFSHVVGVGDNADLGFAAALDWLSRDAKTGVILLDLRRLRDPRRFLSAARAASRLRPVVAIRPGGRLLDADGEADAVLHAALARAGVLAVDTFDDLLAAAETLTRARQPRNETLAIVASEAGPAHLAADAAIREGLRLTELAPETRLVLAVAGVKGSEAPSATAAMEAGSGRDGLSGRKDPQDEQRVGYVGAVPAIRLAEIAALLAGAREVGGVMIVHVPRGAGDDAAIAGIVAASQAIRVPLLVCAMGETAGSVHRRTLAEAGVAVFATPEQAVRGFLHLVQNRRNRAAAGELPPSRVLRLAPDTGEVARRFRRVRDAGRDTLLQDEAMAVLSAYGVPVATSRVAMSADDAVDAARLLGFPVALKLRRSARPDASGPVGVALDLRDEPQLRRAAAALAARRPAAGEARGGEPPSPGAPGPGAPGPGAPGPDDPPGFLVQRQVGRARELRILVRTDPLFGPSIGFGQGGTAATLAGSRDLAIDLPPLNLPLAQALIARTRAAASLEALRDAPAANVAAVAETLVRVSQLLIDFSEIAELDVNPLFADADGVVVADAWVRLRDATEPAAKLALPAYPAELVASLTRKGERFTIRPIRFEDAAAHAAMFRRLTPEDIRYRFFSAMRELTPEQIGRMTQIDYDREMAFVAVREATGETVGVGRLIIEGDSGTGEFAVVVQPDVKGRGLATELMERLIAWGRGAGLAVIVGQVLAENAPMLAFVRHLGFEVGLSPDDSTVMEARMRLG